MVVTYNNTGVLYDSTTVAYDGGVPLGRPTAFKVEIMFGSGYTDVTEYHDYREQTVIKRGRNSVLDTAQPGTLTLVLFNNDGRFSPVSSSPYYPKIRPNIRIRVTVNGSIRFTGFIDDWIPLYPTGADSDVRVRINATDQTRLLSRHTLDSTYTETVRMIEPTAAIWQWDAAGTVCADVMGNAAASWLMKSRAGSTGSSGTNSYAEAGPPRVSSGVRLQPGSLVKPGVGATEPSNGGYVVRLPTDLNFSISASASWTLGFWAKIDALYDGGSVGAPDRYKAALVGSDGMNSWWVDIQSADGVAAKVRVGDDGPLLEESATIPALVGDWHYWTIVWSDTYQKLAVWRDVVKIVEGYVATPDEDPVTVSLFGQTYLDDLRVFIHPDVTVSSVTYIAAEVSSSDIAKFYQASASGFAGETTWERATRLFAVADLGVGTYLADSGPSAHYGSAQATHGAFDTLGKTVLALGQEIAQAERGLFFVSPNGIVRMADRYARAMSSTPVAVFDQEADTSGTDYSAPIRDAQIVNRVTVTSANGGSATAVDYDSITDNGGILASTIALGLNDAVQGADYANWVVAQFARAYPRIDRVTIDLLTSNTQGIYATAMNLDIGSRIQITGLPAGSVSTIFEGYIEGFTEVYSNTEASLTLDTSPVTPGEIILDDEVLGRLAADGETTSGFNASATSFTVGSHPGFSWDADDLPYDIQIGSEQMTVTWANAPSYGSQTLTVTRGVNGTTATSHDSSEEVSIVGDIVLGY